MIVRISHNLWFEESLVWISNYVIGNSTVQIWFLQTVQTEQSSEQHHWQREDIPQLVEVQADLGLRTRIHCKFAHERRISVHRIEVFVSIEKVYYSSLVIRVKQLQQSQNSCGAHLVT